MADDVTINVGAENMASKILDEIQADAKQLSQSVRGMSRQVASAGKKVEIAFNGMKAAAGPLLVALGAFKAIQSTFSFGSASVDAFNVQTGAVRELTNAIELNNGAAESVAGFEKYAASLQKLTNVGDEVTLDLLAQASALGVADVQLESVATTAIGMAEVTGQTLPEALRKVNETLSGNVTAFGEYLPAIKNTKNESEALAIVQQTAEKGLAQLQSRAGSVEGVMTRASNAIGDLQEVIGRMLAPVRKLVAVGVASFGERLQYTLGLAADAGNDFADRMSGLFDIIEETGTQAANVIGTIVGAVTGVLTGISSAVLGTEDTFQGLANGIVATIRHIGETVVKGITFVEVVLLNLPKVASLVVSSVQLSLLRFVEDAKHFFTVAAPAYIQWFADNWPAIMGTAARNARAAFLNAMRDLGPRIVNALSEAATKGMEVMVAFTKSMAALLQGIRKSLTSSAKLNLREIATEFVVAMAKMQRETSQSFVQGFTAEMEALPNVAERAMTSTEQVLAQRVAELGGTLGTEFREKVEQRLGKIGADIELPELNLSASLAGLGNFVTPGQPDASQTLQASESRLLTRGNGDQQNMATLARNSGTQIAVLRDIEGHLAKERGGINVRYVG